MEKIKLNPDSEGYSRLSELLKGNVRQTDQVRSEFNRYREWAGIEKQLWTYTSLTTTANFKDDDAQKIADELLADNVHIPVVAGMIQTALTVLWGMNATTKPLFGLQARRPYHILASKLEEINIQDQVEKRKLLLRLYTASYNALVYGFSAIHIPYIREKVTIERQRAKIVNLPQGGFRAEYETYEEEEIDYEGNDFIVVNPYDFGCDWRFPIHRFQEGSFVFRRYLVHADDLNEKWQNLKELRESTGDTLNSELYPTRQQDSRGRSVSHMTAENKKRGYHEIFQFFAKIIPKKFELTDTTKRQIWRIEMSDTGIIHDAERMKNSHGQFPYTCKTPYPLEDSPYPTSFAEIMRGMQEEINWLVNTHRQAVRRSLGGFHIFNSHYLSADRLAPARFSKNVPVNVFSPTFPLSNLIHKVPTDNPTGDNMALAQQFTQVMKEATGITDMLQGIPFKGRRTAKEIGGLTQFAVSRLQSMAAVMAVQEFPDMVNQMVKNDQYFKTEETWVQLLGEEYKELKQSLLDAGMMGEEGFLRIGKDDIQGKFSPLLKHPLLPDSDPSMVDAWKQIFQLAVTSLPQLREEGKTVDFGVILEKMGEIFNQDIRGLIRDLPPPPQMQEQVPPGGIPNMQGAVPPGVI